MKRDVRNIYYYINITTDQYHSVNLYSFELNVFSKCVDKGIHLVQVYRRQISMVLSLQIRGSCFELYCLSLELQIYVKWEEQRYPVTKYINVIYYRGDDIECVSQFT